MDKCTQQTDMGQKPNVGARIHEDIDGALVRYTDRYDYSRSEVVQDALGHYLLRAGYLEEIPGEAKLRVVREYVRYLRRIFLTGWIVAAPVYFANLAVGFIEITPTESWFFWLFVTLTIGWATAQALLATGIPEKLDVVFREYVRMK